MALCSANLCLAAGPNNATITSNASANAAIDQILQEEGAGKPANRLENVANWKSTAAQGDELTIPEAVRWQTGELKSDDTWLSVENLSEASLPSKVKEYRALKRQTKLDLAGHRRLAQYCQENKLKEQASSHWYGVLAFDPQNVEARRALGFVNFSDRWVSRNEIITAREATKAIEESCKTWLPKLQKWIVAIEGKDTQKRLAAIRELKAVEDPNFVHAARLATPRVSPTTATHLVQVIRKFRSRDAAQTLASIAVQDLATTASQAAVEGLKEFPLESYVSDLLDLMAVETTLQEQVVTQPNGALVLQLVQEREWRNQRSHAWFDKHLWAALPDRAPLASTSSTVSRTKRNADQSKTTTSVSRGVRETDVVVAPNPIVLQATQQEAKRIASTTIAQTEIENAIIRERQKNIATILRGVTDANIKSDDAREWWAWWDEQQESYLAENKPVHYGYEVDSNSPVYRPQRLNEVTSTVTENVTPPPRPPVERGRRVDCLVAGTMITTETGLVPVDEISIGDRVLSQDIKTGELALKPVLRTAIRPPAPTHIIKLSSGEEVQCTLGHPWWVIGKGWVKSKDLTAGMHLRTPKSTVEIVEITFAENVQTYNLVVADNNSYFAGNDRLLSYDGNEVVHTFQTVPGLPADTKRKSLASSR